MGSKRAVVTEKYDIVYKKPIKLVQGERVRVLKYETAAENRAKRANTAVARRLRAELDEIGADGYRRRQREAQSK